MRFAAFGACIIFLSACSGTKTSPPLQAAQLSGALDDA